MKKLRDYQIKMIDTIRNDFNNYSEVVMAMCPNAGKTFTTIKLMERVLREEKFNKILVLAHGTTILRNQFYDNVVEERPSFTCKEINPSKKDTKAQVLVTLPQSAKNLELGDIDLIVVDEAHERYFGKEVQSIVKKSKCKNILLLTGTPSKFIYENNKLDSDRFKINLIAMSDISHDYMANVQVLICSSSYNIKSSDFNSEQNLKESKKLSKKDTENTLGNLLQEIIKVLKMRKISNIDNLFPVAFNKLKKTMIVCHSQKQAMYVNNFLNKKGVKSVVSTEDSDIYSENIAEFIENDDIKCLIVVRRGILGFNLPTLVNVVDMSGTRNLDRMYQMFSRITRVHSDVEIKRYFKIAPRGEVEYTEYVTAAMLSLIHRDNISIYNGKNFKTEVPILIEKRKESGSCDGKESCGGKKSSTKLLKFDGLNVIVEFTKLYSNIDKTLQIYSKANLQEIMYNMGRINSKNIVDITEEMFKNILKKDEVDRRIYGEY